MQGDCSICRYWQSVWTIRTGLSDKRSKRGMCRRHAPSPSALSVEFPRTKFDDWCGEYDPREDERRVTARETEDA